MSSRQRGKNIAPSSSTGRKTHLRTITRADISEHSWLAQPQNELMAGESIIKTARANFHRARAPRFLSDNIRVRWTLSPAAISRRKRQSEMVYRQRFK